MIIFKKLITVLILSILTTTTACASDQVMVPVSSKAKMVIAIDENGETVTIKGIQDGKVTEPGSCLPCSAKLAHEFDGHCDRLLKDEKLRKKVVTKLYGKKLSSMPICGATTRATITEIRTITVGQSHKNPDCLWKWEENGRVIKTIPENCAH